MEGLGMASKLGLYNNLLTEIKDRVRQAQTHAALSANAEMIALYWDIGRMIHQRQQTEGWGAGVIPRLASDLKNELPEEKGFSERNIKRMLTFFREYPVSGIVPQPVAQLGDTDNLTGKVPRPVAQPGTLSDRSNLQQLVAKIPWGHNLVLMEKVKDLPTRLWYMEQTIEQGWSRDTLVTMIKSNAHARQGQVVSNFSIRLPAPQSELVRQLLKDPYLFDFLTIGLILCQTKDRILAEYTLRDIHKPIGISAYELTRSLPENLKSSLPTVEEIEAELALEVGE
jgi:predicted nuclease of restriction endonuclease-like (RecB) superfamily